MSALNRRNFLVLKEIGVEEQDGDVRYYSGSGNIAVSCMRSASGHNYIEQFGHCGLGYGTDNSNSRPTNNVRTPSCLY